MSLERVIMRGIEWCAPMPDDPSSEFEVWLDAALEYWLMKFEIEHESSISIEHWFDDIWDVVHGWQCSCLSASTSTEREV